MITNGSFSPSSRYARLATATYVDAQGNSYSYMTRRFLPPGSSFTLLQQYSIVEGDRLDNLSAKFLGDSEMFWRLCDANDAMEPDELVAQIGRALRITLPEGVPPPVTNAK